MKFTSHELQIASSITPKEVKIKKADKPAIVEANMDKIHKLRQQNHTWSQIIELLELPVSVPTVCNYYKLWLSNQEDNFDADY